MKKSFLRIFLFVPLLIGAGCTSVTANAPATGVSSSTPSSAFISPSTPPVSSFGTASSTGRLLTAADFDEAYSYHEDKDAFRDVFRVRVSPRIPPFIIRVTSYSSTTRGMVEVFRENDLTTPIQTLHMVPDDQQIDSENSQREEEMPRWFTLKDVNFDGYADIGVMSDGGAKWASYQYWTFNSKTGMFEDSDFSKAFRGLVFNDIKFDAAKKRIIFNDFFGALMAEKDMYTVRNGELKQVEKDFQDQAYVDGQVSKRCTITTTEYDAQGAPHESRQVVKELCQGYFDLEK